MVGTAYPKPGAPRGAGRRTTSSMRTALAALAVTALAVAVTVVVVRPQPAGAAGEEWVDPAFGSGGVTLMGNESVTNAAIDTTGRTYVATAGDEPGRTVRRLTADGLVDNSFAGGGLALDFAIDSDALVAGADGTLTVARSDFVDGIVVSRFTSTGQPDITFGVLGSLTLLDGMSVGVGDIAERPNGALMLLAHGASASYLMAVTGDGELDPTWAPARPRRASWRSPRTRSTTSPWTARPC